MSSVAPNRTQTPLVGALGLKLRGLGKPARHQYSNVDPATGSASPGTIL